MVTQAKIRQKEIEATNAADRKAAKASVRAGKSQARAEADAKAKIEADQEASTARASAGVESETATDDSEGQTKEG